MAYKYKKWKIKWQPSKRKFKKIKRDRQASRKAYVNWRKNKSKMLTALRRSKAKRKLQMKKNKAMGMYKKLAIARKRWKNILKSDVNLDNMLDGRLYLDEGNYYIESDDAQPVIDITNSDIPGIITILKTIKDTHEWDNKDDEKVANDFIDDSIKYLNTFKDAKELYDTDKDFLEDIISFVEDYAEDIGILDDVEDFDQA